MFVESETPTLDELAEQSWIWIVDLQRVCSLVIGYSLSGLLFGYPLDKYENLCKHWLSNEIFSSGIENLDVNIDTLQELSYIALSDSPELTLNTIEKLPSYIQNLLRFALMVPNQYDEACSVPRECSLDTNIFFEELTDMAEEELWEFDEDEKHFLDTTKCCLLTTLLKQTGMLQRRPDDPAVEEIYDIVLNFSNKFITKVNSIKFKKSEDSECDALKCKFNERKTYHKDDYNFRLSMQDVVERCLFLLVFVKGKIIFLK